jgi:hypothetical protein
MTKSGKGSPLSIDLLPWYSKHASVARQSDRERASGMSAKDRYHDCVKIALIVNDYSLRILGFEPQDEVITRWTPWNAIVHSSNRS